METRKEPKEVTSIYRTEETTTTREIIPETGLEEPIKSKLSLKPEHELTTREKLSENPPGYHEKHKVHKAGDKVKETLGMKPKPEQEWRATDPHRETETPSGESFGDKLKKTFGLKPEHEKYPHEEGSRRVHETTSGEPIGDKMKQGLKPEEHVVERERHVEPVHESLGDKLKRKVGLEPEHERERVVETEHVRPVERHVEPEHESLGDKLKRKVGVEPEHERERVVETEHVRPEGVVHERHVEPEHESLGDKLKRKVGLEPEREKHEHVVEHEHEYEHEHVHGHKPGVTKRFKVKRYDQEGLPILMPEGKPHPEPVGEHILPPPGLHGTSIPPVYEQESIKHVTPEK